MPTDKTPRDADETLALPVPDHEPEPQTPPTDAGTVVITDLGSRTGVFVRVRGEQELSHGDELLIGRTRLVVDFKTPRAA